MRLAETTYIRLPALLATCITTSAALALLSGCSVDRSPTVSQASTATPSPTQIILPPSTPPPTVTGTLSAPPSNCHTSPPIQTMTVNDFGGGFIGTTTFAGASPAWELGFGSEMAMSGTPYPSTKIMWVVGPNYAQPVTLSGHELRTGAPLWFDIYPNNRTGGDDYYTTSATLDPSAPNRGSTDNSTGQWNIWGIGIIATAAGCYQLDVTSSAGTWHAVLAVGGR